MEHGDETAGPAVGVIIALPEELSSREAEELQRIKWHRKQLLEDIQKLKDEIADVFAQIDCFESAEER
ncbi:Cytohesin-4 [Saguinus oedipus]|uniref:Cytohesin-4 n=1 Tax=Saguinus oedipus TaxID=9490 RepID=A0ABQ9WIJ4_SAGOE|nr:Cytohesin-4 [Saguinus oedipus]